MSARPAKKSNGKKSHVTDTPLAEWIVGAFGLMIVAAAIGILVYESAVGDKSPPDVKLTVQTIARQRNGYLVRLRANNEGGQPAARVTIKVELMDKEQVLEESETQLDYLPAHSIREAGVFFTREPRPADLRLRAVGYEKP